MFFEVSSTRNSKKIIFGAIKNKMSTLSSKEKIDQPTFYPVSNYFIYIFGKEFINKNNQDFINIFKIVKFTKNNFQKLDRFVIFFEKDGRLNALIKDKEKVFIDADHSLEMASLLLFYERYYEENKLFFLKTTKIEEIINSLNSIYELSESIFQEITEEINDEDIAEIQENMQFGDMLTKFKESISKAKEKNKESSSENLEKIKKMKKYIKPMIMISMLSGLLYAGYSYFEDKKAQEEKQIQANAQAEKMRKQIDLSTANKNYSRTEAIRKYLNDENASVVTMKGETITTLIPSISDKEKYNYIFKISNTQYYIEGPYESKNKIKTIRDLKPINFNLLFNDFNRKGYKQENFMILTTELSKERMNELLTLLSKDNIYTFDMFVKYNTIDNAYSVNMNIYKSKKKDSKNSNAIEDFKKRKKEKVEE